MKEKDDGLDKLSRERVEEFKQTIADCLNRLEGIVEPFKYVCQRKGWNDEVAFEVEDAMMKMGLALATLVNWWKDDEAAKEEGK